MKKKIGNLVETVLWVLFFTVLTAPVVFIIAAPAYYRITEADRVAGYDGVGTYYVTNKRMTLTGTINELTIQKVTDSTPAPRHRNTYVLKSTDDIQKVLEDQRTDYFVH